MKENISPEEKLLRLIRGEKKTKPQSPPNLTDTLAPKINIKGTAHVSPQKLFTFDNFRKLLPFLMAVSLLYLIASLIYPLVGLKKIKLPQISKERIEEPVLGQKEEIKPYEFYLEGIKQRQIFATPQTSGSAASAGAETTSIKDINLVGIIAGDNPQAIIEDKKAQKTYYVTKGQIIGEFMVEDIQEGKIILSNRGQKFELHI